MTRASRASSARVPLRRRRRRVHVEPRERRVGRAACPASGRPTSSRSSGRMRSIALTGSGGGSGAPAATARRPRAAARAAPSPGAARRRRAPSASRARASGSTVGESSPGSRPTISSSDAVGRVQHQVAAAAGDDDAANDGGELVGDPPLGRLQVGPGHQHRLGLEHGRDRPQAVLAQRLAALDEVDRRPRRRPAAAPARPTRARPPSRRACRGSAKNSAGDAGVRRRHPAAVEVGERRRSPAPVGTATCSEQRPNPSATSSSSSRAALGHLVAAGHRRLDRAVDGPRGHVLGPREQHLDVPLRAVRVERAAVALELEPGRAHEVERGLVQPPLGRQRQPEAAAHRRLARPVEHEPVAALAVPQPVGDAGDGGRRSVHALGHLRRRGRPGRAGGRRASGARAPRARAASRRRAGTRPPRRACAARAARRTGRRPRGCASRRRRGRWGCWAARAIVIPF